MYNRLVSNVRYFDFRSLRNCFRTCPVRFYTFVCLETLTQKKVLEIFSKFVNFGLSVSI